MKRTVWLLGDVVGFLIVLGYAVRQHINEKRKQRARTKGDAR